MAPFEALRKMLEYKFYPEREEDIKALSAETAYKDQEPFVHCLIHLWFEPKVYAALTADDEVTLFAAADELMGKCEVSYAVIHNLILLAQKRKKDASKQLPVPCATGNICRTLYADRYTVDELLDFVEVIMTPQQILDLLKNGKVVQELLWPRYENFMRVFRFFVDRGGKPEDMRTVICTPEFMARAAVKSSDADTLTYRIAEGAVRKACAGKGIFVPPVPELLYDLHEVLWAQPKLKDVIGRVFTAVDGKETLVDALDPIIACLREEHNSQTAEAVLNTVRNALEHALAHGENLDAHVMEIMRFLDATYELSVGDAALPTEQLSDFIVHNAVGVMTYANGAEQMVQILEHHVHSTDVLRLLTTPDSPVVRVLLEAGQFLNAFYVYTEVCEGTDGMELMCETLSKLPETTKTLAALGEVRAMIKAEKREKRARTH